VSKHAAVKQTSSRSISSTVSSVSRQLIEREGNRKKRNGTDLVWNPDFLLD